MKTKGTKVQVYYDLYAKEDLKDIYGFIARGKDQKLKSIAENEFEDFKNGGHLSIGRVETFETTHYWLKDVYVKKRTVTTTIETEIEDINL